MGLSPESKEKIKSDPVFEKVRMNNSEFAGCAKAAGKFRSAILGVKYLADYNYPGTIVQITSAIQKLDTTGLIGQRSILVSQHWNILGGFNLNETQVFDSVAKHSPAFTISRIECKATLYFPELFPKINLIDALNLGRYRFIATLGIIPDMVYSEMGYQQASDQVKYNPVKYESDWYRSDIVNGERTVEIKLGEDAFLDESGRVIVTVGIEFGKMVTDSMVKIVRFAGCAKVLGVG